MITLEERSAQERDQGKNAPRSMGTVDRCMNREEIDISKGEPHETYSVRSSEEGNLLAEPHVQPLTRIVRRVESLASSRKDHSSRVQSLASRWSYALALIEAAFDANSV